MTEAGVITKQEAVLRVSTDNVLQLLHPQFALTAVDDARRAKRFLAKGVNASPGAAVGVVAFDADLAEKWGKAFIKPDQIIEFAYKSIKGTH